MKIPNEYLIIHKNFTNIYCKCTQNRYHPFAIDATRTSDSFTRFRTYLFETIQKLIMTMDEKIKDQKL